MKYLLIKGSLHVVGYSPDGDSMMFKAANPALWDRLENDNKDTFTEKLTKENGAVQLRLEGIDALETHYSPMPLPTPPDLKSKKKTRLGSPLRAITNSQRKLDVSPPRHLCGWWA